MDPVDTDPETNLEQGEHRCDICFTLWWFKLYLFRQEDTTRLTRPPRREWRQKLKQSQFWCFFVFPLCLIMLIHVLITQLILCTNHRSSMETWGISLGIILPSIIFLYFMLLYKLVQYKCCSHIYQCGRVEILSAEYQDMDLSKSDKNLYPWTIFADKMYNTTYSDDLD